MAFVSIDREDINEEKSNSITDEEDEDSSKGTKSSKSKSQGEDFFTCKGAAVGLRHGNCKRRFSCVEGDFNIDLKKMLLFLRKDDCLKLVVELQCCHAHPKHHRYLSIIEYTGNQDTPEAALLGIDILDGRLTLGLVLEVWMNMKITLDGDGGFKVHSTSRDYLVKPVSVQAMWSAMQTLQQTIQIAKTNSYTIRGLTHTWVGYYRNQITSSTKQSREWNAMEDIETSLVNSSSLPLIINDEEQSDLEKMQYQLSTSLKKLMLQVDLETVNVLQLRKSLEETLGIDLTPYKHYIEKEVLRIYGQMDQSSQIFDHVFLGSIFNASNLEELEVNGVTHILNVTREIDNFFLDRFTYKNIRVYDEETVDLLQCWEDTHRFINEAKSNGTKCLVHCKMGVSRSASTVIAYAMKEYGWNLENAFEYVKSKRSCVQPNSGFMEQLKTYEGILVASNNRHKPIFKYSPTSAQCVTKDSPKFFVASPLEETSQENEKINLDQEIFLYKRHPGKKRPHSKTTSLLSNISNRSTLADGPESESGNLTSDRKPRESDEDGLPTTGDLNNKENLLDNNLLGCTHMTADLTNCKSENNLASPTEKTAKHQRNLSDSFIPDLSASDSPPTDSSLHTVQSPGDSIQLRTTSLGRPVRIRPDSSWIRSVEAESETDSLSPSREHHQVSPTRDLPHADTHSPSLWGHVTSWAGQGQSLETDCQDEHNSSTTSSALASFTVGSPSSQNNTPSGTPNTSNGTPNTSSGTPNTSSGTPYTSSGTHNSSGVEDSPPSKKPPPSLNDLPTSLSEPLGMQKGDGTTSWPNSCLDLRPTDLSASRKCSRRHSSYLASSKK